MRHPSRRAVAIAASATAVPTRDDGAPEKSTFARGLVISRASIGDTVTPAASRATVCNSSPSAPATGTTNTSASPAPATLVIRPVKPLPAALTPAIASLGAVDSGTASAAVADPVANPLTVSVSPACNRATVASTALDRNGTGATARPISSITTAASRALAPAPPSCSGTNRPAIPSSAASVCQTPEKSCDAAS